MKIVVSGQHMKIGESFQEYIESQIKNVITKYFDDAVSAHVVVIKEKAHYIKTDITINKGCGTPVIKSTAHDDDPYRSFDESLHKAEKQLSKYKDKIKAHHKIKASSVVSYDAKKYVLSPFADDKAFAESFEAPVIIAEKINTITKMSVSEAVMQMDLLNLHFYVFINVKTNRINMVNYKEDGNISWLDLYYDEK